MITYGFHEDFSVIRSGTEEPRAYYLPQDGATLLSSDSWRFSYFRSFSDISEDMIGSLDESSSETVTVPSCWQMHGHDTLQYTNDQYPIPYDPPYVPAAVPAGIYERSREGVLARDFKKHAERCGQKM